MVAIMATAGDTAESHGNLVNGVIQKLHIKTNMQLATLLMTANVHSKNVRDIVIFSNENVHSKTKLNNKITLTFYIKPIANINHIHVRLKW